MTLAPAPAVSRPVASARTPRGLQAAESPAAAAARRLPAERTRSLPTRSSGMTRLEPAAEAGTRRDNLFMLFRLLVVPNLKYGSAPGPVPRPAERDGPLSTSS